MVTGRARSRIRHVLKLEQVEHGKKLGQELLERDLRRRRLNYSKLFKSGQIARVAKELSYKNVEALLQSIAYGKVNTKQVIRKLGVDLEEPEKEPSFFERVFRSRGDGAGVKVGGLDQVLVRFGQCCSPVPGDAIEGFITRGRGVTVHLRNCPKVFHLDPERRVPVSWDDIVQEPRRVKVRVVSEDRQGLLAAVSDRISAEKVNIEAAKIHTADNRAIQNFDLSVPDRRHLDAVLKSISKLPGVLHVERVHS